MDQGSTVRHTQKKIEQREQKVVRIARLRASRMTFNFERKCGEAGQQDPPSPMCLWCLLAFLATFVFSGGHDIFVILGVRVSHEWPCRSIPRCLGSFTAKCKIVVLCIFLPSFHPALIPAIRPSCLPALPLPSPPLPFLSYPFPSFSFLFQLFCSFLFLFLLLPFLLLSSSFLPSCLPLTLRLWSFPRP